SAIATRCANWRNERAGLGVSRGGLHPARTIAGAVRRFGGRPRRRVAGLDAGPPAAPFCLRQAHPVRPRGELRFWIGEESPVYRWQQADGFHRRGDVSRTQRTAIWRERGGRNRAHARTCRRRNERNSL